jgi:hyperosmotically inducible periplasmic protein
MKTPQLVMAALAAALIPASACNRADTDENARRAAAGMREAAVRAGDRLADSWLTTKIQAQYFADEDIKARYINVSTREGVVTLKGRVDSERAREEALNIARYTDGVTRVEDQMTVGASAAAGAAPETPGPADVGSPVATTGTLPADAGVARIDDASVTSRIQAKYFLDRSLKERRIEVDTRERVVTLRGELASDNERAQALLLARSTEGVERVEDALTVNAALGPAGVSGEFVPAQPPAPPHSDDEALAARVQSRWSAEPDLKALAIQVTAKDGVLLVEGTLPTAAAKRRAMAVARGTEGVVQVIDRVRVGRTR